MGKGRSRSASFGNRNDIGTPSKYDADIDKEYRADLLDHIKMMMMEKFMYDAASEGTLSEYDHLEAAGMYMDTDVLDILEGVDPSVRGQYATAFMEAAAYVSYLKQSLGHFEDGVKSKLRSLTIEDPLSNKGNEIAYISSGLGVGESGNITNIFKITLSGVLEECVRPLRQQGFTIGGDKVMGAVSHEFGHYLQYVLWQKRPSAFGISSSTDAHNRYLFFSRVDDKDVLNFKSSKLKALRDRLKGGVSVYGETDYSEAFAEAASAYVMGIKPKKGTEYYSEFKKLMSDVGLQHLEGITKKFCEDYGFKGI